MVVQLGKTRVPKQYALLLEQRDGGRWHRHVVIVQLRHFWGPQMDTYRALAALSTGACKLVDDRTSLIPGVLSFGAARLKLEFVRVLVSEGQPRAGEFTWDAIITPSRIQCSRLVADAEVCCA
jgi:hypothetical protein